MLNISNNQQYYCAACPDNCINCTATANSQGQYTTVCNTCQLGYLLLTSGQCLACGYTNNTIGCQKCSTTGVCQSCQNGLILNQSNMCQAPVIDAATSSHKGIYVALLVIFSVLCAILLGLIIYNIVIKRNENQGMYSEIR